MTRPVLVLAALVALGLSGCDQITGSDESDQERIAGAWTATLVNVRVQGVPVGIPVSDLTSPDEENRIAFRTDGTFTFVYNPADGRRLRLAYQGTTYVDVPLDQTVTLSGMYTVDEDADEIRFSTLANQTADDFSLGYGFGLGGTDLELDAEDPGTLALLFGLAGDDAAQFSGVVAGGSITYSRDPS